MQMRRQSTVLGPSLAGFDQLLSMDGPSIDQMFDREQARNELFSEVSARCERAYKERDEESLYAIQYMLYKIYQLHLTIPPPGVKTPESSAILLGVRNLIERSFEEYEDSLIPISSPGEIPDTSAQYVPWLIEKIRTHPAYRHSLYEDYLNKKATTHDLRNFLIQETTIDSRFDDFLALIQLGAKDRVKLEIATNYWDEMGGGDRAKMHTNMFFRTLEALKIGAEESRLTTESLVCGNLSLMFSLRRDRFYKAIGYFVVTEYLSPERFEHVLAAWARNGLDNAAADYHRAHVSIDGDHSHNWFENVIVPVIDETPEAVFDITRGAFYRLNTSQRYLDGLMRGLKN